MEITIIKQLLPADGWNAVFLDSDQPHVQALVAWALVDITHEDETISVIEGMIPRGEYGDVVIEMAQGEEGFYTYAHDKEIDDMMDQWIASAQERHSNGNADH